MRLYEIYANQDKCLRVIKSGFIWPAFLFVWLWTALQKEYQLALPQFILWVFLLFLALSCYFSWGWLTIIPHWGSILTVHPLIGTILGTIFGCCLVVFHFYVGIFSHYWLRNVWVSRDGFQRLSNLLARSKRDAVNRYRSNSQS